MVKYEFIERFTETMGVDIKHDYDAKNRENLLKSVKSILHQSRMNSCCLIGPPGTGKTQAIETLARQMYNNSMIMFSVDIVSMGGQGENKFAENIKALVEEIKKFDEESDEMVVIFIDEFHILGKPNYSAGLESLKPVLARGDIRFIGATTDEEYVDHIAKDEALKERLQRLDVNELERDTIIEILVDMWKTELPIDEPVNLQLINKIVDYGRYTPSEAEPRKSIKLLDQLIGWYRTENVMINENLLDKRMYETLGVNTKHKVDINEVLENHCKKRVKGQEFAIEQIEGRLHIAHAGINNPNRPMANFLFLGPTGVGKTELAKALAEGLFGSEEKMIRFDMSEFQTKDRIEDFRTRVSDKITKTPFSVVLFDEVEKAEKGVMDLMLQITDDGRLNDRYGRQVTFRNAYIIMTTNIGHEIFEEARSESRTMNKKMRLVNEILQAPGAFRPELVGRMDKLVPFEPLSKEVRLEIVKTRLSEFTNMLKEQKIKFEYGDRVETYLAFEGVSNETTAGGGRDINRKINDTLYVIVAKLINEYKNEYNHNKELKYIKVDVFGLMRQESKYEKEGQGKLGILNYVSKTNNGDYEQYYGNSVMDGSELYEATSEKGVYNFIPKEEYQVRKKEKQYSN